jgi:predicted nucleic acid-binding protein
VTVSHPLPVAVLDTSVLYPAWSRTLLSRFASDNDRRVQAIWSREIMRDLWRTVVERGVARGHTFATAQNEAAALFAPLGRALSLADGSTRSLDVLPSPFRDPNDEHLWNAAVNAGAGYIVSHNTRDFPPLVAVPAGGRRHLYGGIEFLTAIEFIEGVLGEDAATLYGRALPQGIVRSGRTGR